LAVRELMRSEVAVLNQGIRNANDAISMLQTMDGAAQVIDEKLIRMKELAEQAATGTYNDSQRSIMNDEFDAMRDEIERIAQATDFNGVKMLNATSGGTQEVLQYVGSAGANSGVSTSLGTYFGATVTSGASSIQVTLADGTTSTVAFTWETTSATLQTLTSAIDGVVSVAGSVSNFLFSLTQDAAGDSEFDVQIIQGGSTLIDFSTLTEGTNGQVKIHFGTGNESAEDYYYVNKQDMTATGLGLDSLSIATQGSAQTSLESINTAITTKDTARAHFGATMNRLSNTVSNLTIQAENIQAAESQISDVDVAWEMTQFVNNQIKSQAAVAMLAQANSVPQLALSLLGG